LHSSTSSRGERHDGAAVTLSRAEAQAREQILTQPEPAKIRKSTDAIVLKGGDLFLVATESGDVPFTLPHAYGLFFRDCRFLDGYTVRVDGVEPVVLGGTTERSVETRHHLTNEELPRAGNRGAVPKNTLALDRERVIRGGVIRELLTVRNHGRGSARFWLELAFRSRFEDLFIVKGFVTGPRGRLEQPHVLDEARVELAYEGRDRRRRSTVLAFFPRPDTLDGERARFDVALEPGEAREFAVAIRPAVTDTEAAREWGPASVMSATRLRHWLERSEDLWIRHAASVHSSNPLFDRVFERALLDLRLLQSTRDGLHFFAAGLPWFGTLFGRDAATVALQTLPYGPNMAGQTLRLLARYQATEADAFRDAAPGKILHELRTGELAHLGAIPQSLAYYGTVDATMLFVILACQYVRWSGDLALAHELRPHLDAALTWMGGPADADSDGYLDYRGRYGTGLVNQGWKDSGNALVDADGAFAEPPIALCEVQAYAYRAWRECGALFRALDDPGAAEKLEQRAADLRARFDTDYWSEALDCYVLARHGAGRRAEVVSSNAGQVLWGGLATPERAARVVARLTADDMFSGWGIRTLSSRARAYNPMSYHLGSVWPHDNALVLAGFRRYGHDAAALRVFEALFEAASRFRSFRLPELFCGFPRETTTHGPVRYPVACSPQAWAAGALPHALWTLLGLSPDALARRLTVRRPRLPDWLARVELGGVHVGEARVDLRFTRGDGGAVDVDAAVREGELDVEVTEEGDVS
jgi:glycogen debranching enzyme